VAAVAIGAWPAVAAGGDVTELTARPLESPPNRGLTSSDAAQRLQQFGLNEIARGQAISPLRLLAAQFNSPIVWLLFGACVVSAALGEIADAVAIGAIVIINGCVGFFQEYRAERAVLALRSMTAPRARVVRDGRVIEVPASHMVPGDVLLLDAGDIVAADARLIEAHALSTNEAALTGESAPAEKSTQPAEPDAPLAERRDHVFLGTAVAAGTGVAEVEATGMRTELGHIARLLSTVQDEATPLQKRLARLSQVLLYLCLAIVGIVALLGWWRGMPPVQLLLAAVSLAVAAVPEGLPAIVTIALAAGVQRMVARHALVRRLLAVETLGCASCICTDKTGTLTTGIMTVREFWGADARQILAVASGCCDAELSADDREGIGDPTEIAILVAAAQRGIRRVEIEHERARVAVNPFDSQRKRMSIFRADGVLYAKGAVESVLEVCRAAPPEVIEANAQMAARGLRVLAVARGSREVEQDLELIGLVGIADPPRTEAIDAIHRAHSAGIRTVMITGDHPATAHAIARELGLARPGERLEDLVQARATPEDKLRIVRHWKSQGAVVAMTGDGVNDAPALREADIGIAMGRTGSEVAREVSDIVLTDDNFATIVAAIEEGRGIFQNIRKTLVYLLAGNAGELLLMLAAAALGLPLPLLPLHLLWINLVTDGLPALTLVSDPVSGDVMKRAPRSPDEPILGRREWSTIVFTGLLQAAIALAVFAWALEARNLEEARNLAFSVLVFGELLRAFSARDTDRPLWEVGLFTNLRLLGVVTISVLVQLGIHHVPAAQQLFQIGDLSPFDCAITVAAGAVPLAVLEATKVVKRMVRRQRGGNEGARFAARWSRSWRSR
jgi:Ca2+-transporting ATPase